MGRINFERLLKNIAGIKFKLFIFSHFTIDISMTNLYNSNNVKSYGFDE